MQRCEQRQSKERDNDTSGREGGKEPTKPRQETRRNAILVRNDSSSTLDDSSSEGDSAEVDETDHPADSSRSRASELARFARYVLGDEVAATRAKHTKIAPLVEERIHKLMDSDMNNVTRGQIGNVARVQVLEETLAHVLDRQANQDRCQDKIMEGMCEMARLLHDLKALGESEDSDSAREGRRDAGCDSEARGEGEGKSDKGWFGRLWGV